MIGLILVLAGIGIVVWAVNTYLPIDPKFKKLITIVAIVCAVAYLLYAFGVLPVHDVPVPQLR